MDLKDALEHFNPIYKVSQSPIFGPECPEISYFQEFLLEVAIHYIRWYINEIGQSQGTFTLR